MSILAESTICPVESKDGPTVYYVTCGLCGHCKPRTSLVQVETWLEKHLDKYCRVARILRMAEAQGLAVEDTVSLALNTVVEPAVEDDAKAR